MLFLSLIMLTAPVAAQLDPYPHNAINCERCHSLPTKFGGSSMTVQRKGALLVGGLFVPASEGGLHHRSGESAENSVPANQITGERVSSLNLLGDGYIEAIDSRDIEQNAPATAPSQPRESRAWQLELQCSKQAVPATKCR
jgi:hypothetical protein